MSNEDRKTPDERIQQLEEEVARLRAALAKKEAVLKQTRDALFRDAGEVVRALGELERRDAAMNEELHRALRFQRAMIEPLPTDDRVVLDAVYLAADVISADFYDVAFLDPDRLRVFLADATGHGIAAGLATMFLKAEYEANKWTCPTPSALIGAINDVMTSRYEMLDLRCTAICLDIHPAAGRMIVATAAHPGPAIARAAGVELLPGGGTFIGLQASLAFPSTAVALERGDLVVAFTDGLVDAADRSGRSFGADRLKAAVAGARTAPAGFGASLVRGLATFVGEGQPLRDDVTAVAIALPLPHRASSASDGERFRT